MIRTTPLRRTILQCSQRTLIDGRTFMETSLEAVRDPAARQVVRRQLHLDLVARQDPDEVHAHLSRDVGQHLVTVLQLHAEHRVRQRLHTACEMSPIRLPTRHWTIALSRLSRVTSRSSWTLAGTGPTGREIAQSA